MAHMNSSFSLTNQARSIERWVIERVAFYLDCRVRDIDPTVPLCETGRLGVGHRPVRRRGGSLAD